MHAVQAKAIAPAWKSHPYNISITSTKRHQGKVHLLGDMLGAGGGVALWLERGCAVSINAPLMMTCNAMQARQQSARSFMPPLDHCIIAGPT